MQFRLWGVVMPWGFSLEGYISLNRALGSRLCSFDFSNRITYSMSINNIWQIAKENFYVGIGFCKKYTVEPIAHYFINAAVLKGDKLSIHELLFEKPFYEQSDYIEVTKNELASVQPVNLVYSDSVLRKIWIIAKEILSIIIFPIKVYNLFHAVLGKHIGKYSLLPAANPKIKGNPEDYAHHKRNQFDINDEWKIKRISFDIDGYLIDGAIMGKESTLQNGRWVYMTNPNTHCYEHILELGFTKDLLEAEDPEDLNKEDSEKGGVEGNIIAFNYPGVGASSGLPNCSAMKKISRVILNFIENEIKANTIFAYGHSIGGAIQGEVLKNYKFKKEIRVFAIKNRTFGSLSKTAAYRARVKFNRLFAWLIIPLIKFVGWQISCFESSKKLEVPELIIQSANVDNDYTDISKNPEKIKDDAAIKKETTLAWEFLKDKKEYLHK